MRWLALLVLCACNQTFGLEDTQARDGFAPFADEDHDGIADDRDNCRSVANNLQEDVDRDGLGDACDHCNDCAPCAMAVNHDEDNDALDDGCDNCPGVLNPDQANRDGDELGDACDPDPDASALPHHRRFFDGFPTLSPDWLQGGAPWVVDDDAIVPMPGLPGGNYALRHAVMKVTAGATWYVEAQILPDMGQAGFNFYAGLSMYHCLVERLSQNWRVNNTGSVTGGVSFPITGPIRLRFSIRGTPVQQYTRCEVIGVFTQESGPYSQIAYPIDIELFTTGKARYSYVEVIGP
jgi:hypothetical protein